MISYKDTKLLVEAKGEKDNIIRNINFSYHLPFIYDEDSEKKTLLGRTLVKLLSHYNLKDLKPSKIVMTIT